MPLGCCDSRIPKSTPTCIVLRPNGQRFVNGLSRSFEFAFPRAELEDRISENELAEVLTQINRTLDMYWACPTCYCCGFLCCLCTLGLSFVLPSLCIGEAREQANSRIRRLNQNVLL